jgi:hypothetical protein
MRNPNDFGGENVPDSLDPTALRLKPGIFI